MLHLNGCILTGALFFWLMLHHAAKPMAQTSRKYASQEHPMKIIMRIIPALQIFSTAGLELLNELDYNMWAVPWARHYIEYILFSR